MMMTHLSRNGAIAMRRLPVPCVYFFGLIFWHNVKVVAPPSGSEGRQQEGCPE